MSPVRKKLYFGIVKYYPTKFGKAFILRRLIPKFVYVFGHKIFLDTIDTLGLFANGLYIHEKLETKLIMREIKRGDVVLDIGAHIGYYTLLFARLVGPRGKVYAFEPNPYNFSLLKKNVKANGYKNVVCQQSAVSDKSGRIKLYLSENNTGDHRIYDSGDGRASLPIKCLKLDDYFKGYDGKINFIKMDVQGAEVNVIKGMSDLLRKNRPAKIVTEFWPFGLKKFGTEIKDYFRLLLEKSFKIYQINESKKRIEPANVKILSKNCKPMIEEESFCNLLLTRKAPNLNKLNKLLKKEKLIKQDA